MKKIKILNQKRMEQLDRDTKEDITQDNNNIT